MRAVPLHHVSSTIAEFNEEGRCVTDCSLLPDLPPHASAVRFTATCQQRTQVHHSQSLAFNNEEP
jgi:hypothetical protein